MPTILDEIHPIARKEHVCDYCGCAIHKGQKYKRQTLVEDYVYDWKSHEECSAIANDLDMFDDCWDEGLSSDDFCCKIDQYIYDAHYDSEIEDIAQNWQRLTMYEKVCKILDELNEPDMQ